VQIALTNTGTERVVIRKSLSHPGRVLFLDDAFRTFEEWFGAKPFTGQIVSNELEFAVSEETMRRIRERNAPRTTPASRTKP